MIEHLLVIAVAFTSFDPEKQSLERFIGDRWSDKFKCVVQLDGHPAAQRSYNILHRIAEELRNPRAHGGFDHQQSRFHFHLPGVGAVPARLTRGGRGTTYTFDSESDQGATSVWSDLDELDSWLQNGPLRFAWRYAESGLDMPFDKDSREWLHRVVADGDEEFDRYVEGMLEWQDRAMNMDW